MDGTGTILGTYTIDRLANEGALLIDNGLARKVDFTLELTRVA
jgi:phage protein U